MPSRHHRTAIVALALLLAGCGLQLDPEVRVIRPIYDLKAGEIPMPNDLVRDAEAGRLDLPVDDEDLTEAKREFYTQLNTLDGWPTTFRLELSFSGPVSGDTVDESTVQIWRWGEQPAREADATRALKKAGTVLTVDPPMTGWMAGTEYVVIVRGGEDGLRGRLNEEVVPDPSFFFVRMDTSLDDPAYEKAFPGDTRDERMESAEDLEEVRQGLTRQKRHD